MYNINTREELEAFISENIINTSDACTILNCSRQNIDDLVKRNKLKPVKVFPRDKLFLKEDILARLK